MSNPRTLAVATATNMHLHGELRQDQYICIRDGLEYFESLKERDQALENMWNEFADVPMNPDTECMEEPFLDFPAGTRREDIWHWFDERHSKGVAYLLYEGAEDYVPETKRLYGLSKLCFECESKTCKFNHGGECRFALVHERKARITDDDGCIDYDYQEGDL